MAIRLLTVSRTYLKAAHRDTFRILAEDGQFEVGLVNPVSWRGERSEEEPQDARGSVMVERLPLRFARWADIHLYHGLRGAVRRFRPDIIKIEEESSSFAALQAVLIARRMGARPILYATDNIDRKPPVARRLLQRFVFDHILAAVVDNEDAADILRRRGFAGHIVKLPRQGVRASLIPAEGPGPSFQEKEEMKRELGLKTDQRWILYNGPLTTEKGIHDLLEACYHLGRQKIAAGLVVIGDGPCLEEIRLSAKRLQGSVMVKFKPAMPSDELARWIMAADVLCFPSQTRSHWKEPFVPQLVEAMAAGTVVVGSDSGETPHVIGSCGLTFAERNPRELYRQLKDLLTDDGGYRSLQLAALAHVRTHYTNHVLAQKLGGLCREVMQTPLPCG